MHFAEESLFLWTSHRREIPHYVRNDNEKHFFGKRLRRVNDGGNGMAANKTAAERALAQPATAGISWREFMLRVRRWP